MTLSRQPLLYAFPTNDALGLCARKRLKLDECVGQSLELGLFTREDVVRARLRLLEHPPHLVVDDAARARRQRVIVRHIDGPHGVAVPVVPHHAARDLGRLADVGRRARRDADEGKRAVSDSDADEVRAGSHLLGLAKHNLLGRATAKRDVQVGLQLRVSVIRHVHFCGGMSQC